MNSELSNMFLVVYSIMFGSLLSAEIGWNFFKKEVQTVQNYRFRIIFLVFIRMLYMVIVYFFLQFTRPRVESHLYFVQLLAVLLLCLPVFGIQQLSYSLGPKPLHIEGIANRDTEFSWVNLGMLSMYGALIGGFVELVLHFR